MTQSHQILQDVGHQLAAAPSELNDNSWRGVKNRLRQVGLRATRQRTLLARLLFSKADRHVTAEILYEEAAGARLSVSLATVYNTLHQFTGAGLLREIAVDTSRAYFDINTSVHHHFFVEDKQELIDVPSSDLRVNERPNPPNGYEIARVDVVIRLRRKQPQSRPAG